MKRISWSILILLIAAVVRADDHHGCSAKGVAGKYSYRLAGSLLTDPTIDTYPTDVPVAGIGTFTLDKNGNVTGGGPYKSGNGLQQVTFSGTFTVDSDCTGSLALDVIVDGQDIGELDLDQVFGDNANEVHWLARSAELVVYFDAKRTSHD
jgi:hypothetical protein